MRKFRIHSQREAIWYKWSRLGWSTHYLTPSHLFRPSLRGLVLRALHLRFLSMFMKSIILLGFLFTPLIRASPVGQTVIGGPPPGIYGTNFTRAGPVDQGRTSFPKEADKDLKGDTVLLQNLLAAEWIVQDLYACFPLIDDFNTNHLVMIATSKEWSILLRAYLRKLVLPTTRCLSWPRFTKMKMVTLLYSNQPFHLEPYVIHAVLHQYHAEIPIHRQNLQNVNTTLISRPLMYRWPIKQRLIWQLSLCKSHLSHYSSLMRAKNCCSIELGSMAYLTGLAQDSVTAGGLATIMGVISAETRHLTWANSGVLGIDPFVGPSDT